MTKQSTDTTATACQKTPETNYGGGYRPTPQDHIRDLLDAATRFEDRAKRAEAQLKRANAYLEETTNLYMTDLTKAKAHATALAEALRHLMAITRNDNALQYREAREALARWEGK